MGPPIYKEPLSPQSPEPIAILGMACRLPGGADSPSALWDLLQDGRSGRCSVPPSRYNVDGFYHPDKNRPGSIHIKDGHFINEDIKQFDPNFFGLSPQEASVMDPQQKKLLEVAYECFESAGISLEALSGSKTGCFVGNFTFEYSQQREPDFSGPYDQTGFSPTLLSNRINYVFNLKGPSFTVDTACSSSMYAVHMACSSLRARDCSAALVGGVNLILGIKSQMSTAKLGVLSPTSTCHTFDGSADGYARADGVGALYLKRLSDAIRDGDPIRAVIRGTAVNANGRTGGITHPSPDGQEQVIRDAYIQAGINPDDTSYFECHGTGTPVGDPIEVEAIGRVFSSGRSKENPLLIGSIKTNLGHSEAASAMAGIMKAVLSLEKDLIPPTIGLMNPNPKINFASANVKVVTENTPFPAGPVKRISINSFGFGGANAHAIVESTESTLRGYWSNESTPQPKIHTRISDPKAMAYGNGMQKSSTKSVKTSGMRHHVKEQLENGSPKSSRSSFLLTFSAHDERTLRANIGRLVKTADKCDIQDLAHTLNTGRSRFFNRAYAVIEQGQLQQGLSELEQNLSTHKSPARRPNLGFIFTGQGAQWPTMGKDLIENISSCLATVRRLDKVLEALPERPTWRIEEVLSAPPETSRIGEAAISQPLCTALQIVLIDLLGSWNIHPAVAIGHSSGEIAAAYAAGYITAAEAITLAYYRGMVVSEARADGCMLAVGLGPQDVKLYLAGNVVIACINSPQSVTLSGDGPDVLAAKERLAQAGVFVRELKTGGKAYHSPHMKTVGEKYEELAAKTFCNQSNQTRPKKIFISSMYGKTLASDHKLDTSYWRANLESPVRFSQAVERLQQLEIPVHHLVELGPHTALEGPLRQICSLWADAPTYTGTLIRNKNAVNCLLKTAGELFVRNNDIAFEKVNEYGISSPAPATIIDLPRYAWTYSELPPEEEPRVSSEYRFRRHKRHDLLGSRVPAMGSVDRTWRNTLRLKDLPWLEDHKIHGRVVLSGTSYVAMAIEALTQASEEMEDKYPTGYIIQNLALKSAILLEGPGVETLFTLMPVAVSNIMRSTTRFEFKVVSATVGSQSWVENCCGQIELENTLLVKEPSWRDTDLVVPLDSDGSKSYEEFRKTGIQYGPAFHGLTDITMNRTKGVLKAQTDLYPTRELMRDESRYAIHPATLDTGLQTAALAMYFGDRTGVAKISGGVPSFIEEIHLAISTYGQEVSTHGTILAWGQKRGLKAVMGGFHIITNQFKLEVKGLRLTSFDTSSAVTNSENGGSIPRHPYLRAIWKPDIDYIPQSFARKALNPAVTKQIGVSSLSHLQLELLEILDLLVHKDPGMNILQIGGTNLLPKILALFQGDSVFRRYRKYTFTSPSVSGGEHGGAELGSNPPYQISFENLEDLQGPFDLIIAPEGTIDDEVLRVIKNSRNSAGRILGRKCALPVSSLDGLEKHLSFHHYTLLKGKVPLESIPDGKSLVLVHRNNPNTELAHVLEKAAQQGGWRVSSHFLRDGGIEKGAVVVVLADVETNETIFQDITDEEYKGLQQLVDSASSCIWVSSVGYLRGEFPSGAMAFGLGRVITIEQPSISFCNLDIQNAQGRPTEASCTILRLLARGSGKKTDDYGYVEQGGLLYVNRLVPDRTENEKFNRVSANEPLLMPRNNMALGMELQRVGDLDTIFFKENTRYNEQLHPEMVEIDVKAVGMNAKDIDIAMGRVDAHMDGVKGHYFSHECAGIVTKVGSKVNSVKPGDHIMCITSGSYGTVERVEAGACCNVGKHIAFAEMATIPVVYTTAIYALNHLARLKKDETILIHTGARGVGIAAIILAKAIGAEIYTTTSSDTKRTFLETLGIPANHIFSSRDSSFIEDVLKATDGEGVDVVLSTLTGPLFYKTAKCVAAAGRFIDLGRHEALDSSILNLYLFSRNVTFSSLDLSKLKPKIMAGLLQEMKDLLEHGVIAPIKPYKTFDVSEIVQAMRYFGTDPHIGKVVVTYERPDSMLRIEPPKEAVQLNGDATYMIVGGLGGLGRSLTMWMLDHGARNFVFLSRSGIKSPNSEAAATIQYVKEAGGHAEAVTGDVAILEDVVRAVKAAKKPIRGVIHAAMILRDCLFALSSVKEFHEVTKPKVQGVMNLHHALSDTPLDFFVMMSSLSGTLGTFSQSNYCASNAALDALARHRHALGLPATSVALTGIEEVGYIHEHPDISYVLERNGFHPLNKREFLLAMEHSMTNKGFSGMSEPFLAGDPHSSNHIITGLEPLRLRSKLAEGFGGATYYIFDRRLAILANALDSNDVPTVENGTIATMSLLELAKKESDIQLTRVLGEIYIDKLSKLLLTPVEQIDPSKSIVAYGMDSMIGGELKNWLYREMSVDLSFLELLSPSITIEKMVSNIKAMLQL